MTPEQLPDLTAELGPIVALPEPDESPFPEHFILFAFNPRSGWYSLGEWYTRRSVEAYASRLTSAHTKYRIVRIPGDEKGAEHGE